MPGHTDLELPKAFDFGSPYAIKPIAVLQKTLKTYQSWKIIIMIGSSRSSELVYVHVRELLLTSHGVYDRKDLVLIIHTSLLAKAKAYTPPASFTASHMPNLRKTAICPFWTVNFVWALWTAPDEPDSELYIIGKLYESSFQKFLRFVHIYFNEEVMAVLVRKGHSARKFLCTLGIAAFRSFFQSF